MSEDKTNPQVWFITGASSGLGLSVLKYVLSKGDRAVATLRNPEAISGLAAKYSALQLLIVKLDVTKEEEIRAAFAAAQRKFGRVDVVYNNAGYATLAEVEGTSSDAARGMFEVNFWGAANVSKESVRFFRDVNIPSGGCLLQASSMGGVAGTPALGYYCASKFALEGLSEALAKELIPSWNIKIVILQLGGFRTKAVRPPSEPIHPAYKESSSVMIREFFAGPLEGIGTSDKAAREMYEIAGDKLAPLHVPLGGDAISVVNTRIVTAKEEVEAAEKWSLDLKEGGTAVSALT